MWRATLPGCPPQPFKSLLPKAAALFLQRDAPGVISEVFRARENEDPLDEAPDFHEDVQDAEAQDGYQQLDQGLAGEPQIEVVDAEPAQQDAKEPCGQLGFLLDARLVDGIRLLRVARLDIPGLSVALLLRIAGRCVGLRLLLAFRRLLVRRVA